MLLLLVLLLVRARLATCQRFGEQSLVGFGICERAERVQHLRAERGWRGSHGESKEDGRVNGGIE